MGETSVRQPSLKELAARCLDGIDKRTSVSAVGGALTADLERRLRAMAKRWRQSEDELVGVLHRAREKPTQWLAAVAHDERRERECERGQLRPDA